jgi:hypothetical protein
MNKKTNKQEIPYDSEQAEGEPGAGNDKRQKSGERSTPVSAQIELDQKPHIQTIQPRGKQATRQDTKN